MAATPQDISMRIAILKAASRVELDRVHDMLIASSMSALLEALHPLCSLILVQILLLLAQPR